MSVGKNGNIWFCRVQRTSHSFVVCWNLISIVLEFYFVKYLSPIWVSGGKRRVRTKIKIRFWFSLEMRMSNICSWWIWISVSPGSAMWMTLYKENSGIVCTESCCEFPQLSPHVQSVLLLLPAPFLHFYEGEPGPSEDHSLPKSESVSFITSVTPSLLALTRIRGQNCQKSHCPSKDLQVACSHLLVCASSSRYLMRKRHFEL